MGFPCDNNRFSSEKCGLSKRIGHVYVHGVGGGRFGDQRQRNVGDMISPGLGPFSLAEWVSVTKRKGNSFLF